MTNNEGEHMNTDTDKPTKGDIYDHLRAPGVWCVVLDDTDHGDGVLIEHHYSDGSIGRYDSALNPDIWRKRPKRPAVPRMVESPIRWVNARGSWRSLLATHSIIRIDLRDGSAVWLPDETPLTDDEREQLWDES